jgi:HEAT repeat protein
MSAPSVRSPYAEALLQTIVSSASRDDAYWENLSMLEKEATRVRPFVAAMCRRTLESAIESGTIVRLLDVLVQIREPVAPLAATFARHPDASVRAAVALALQGSRDPRAIDALVLLSRDGSECVRSDAVRAIVDGLGGPSDRDFVDTPAIRDSLAARVDDECDVARNAALLGLAMRRDRRATEPLATLLGSDEIIGMLVDAAYYLASPALRDVLQWQLDAGNDVSGEWSLEDAVAACTVDLR